MTRIVADSSCNIKTLENTDFISVPMTLYTDDVTYADDETLNLEEMVSYFEKYNGRSYTSCPNVEAWLNAYEGADTVYVVTLTSALSGTYNSAMAAREIYLSEHPDAKIEVFDSKSTGPEMHLIIEKIASLVKQGCDFEEVCTKTRRYMATTKLIFALGSLHNLSQNGRVNKMIASAVGVLGVSIIAKASDEGDIKPISKARGEKRIVSKLIDEMEKLGYKGGKVKMCHILNENVAIALANSLKEKFEKVEIEFYKATGLCSYYAERGGLIVGLETETV